MKNQTLNKITNLFLALSFIVMNITPSHAAGPLVVSNGEPVVWQGSLVYRLDQGTLGSLSNGEAVTLIDDLLSSWEGVATANFSFEKDTPDNLGVDVMSTNHAAYTTDNVLGYSPIIFDTDGSIIDSYIGSGQRNRILGFAGPKVSDSGPEEILEALAVFNGRFIDGIDSGSTNPEVSLDAFRGTILHEFGHALGLDHSQINKEAATSSNQTILDSAPLMFPLSVNDLYEIKTDDAASISLLYPNSTELMNYGSISGNVYRSNGLTPVLGANIIARKVGGALDDAVSCVSDYLVSNTGEYKLSALPPGDYKITVEAIEDDFTGGSSVGPYANTGNGQSFINPVPFGYYTGDGLPISSDSNDALAISVSAGQNLTGKDIIASYTSSTSSCGGEINESEPNDTLVGAQDLDCIPITIDGTAADSDTGDIVLTAGDGSMLTLSDVYRFTTTEPGTFNTSLFISSTVSSTDSGDDLDLILLDELADNIISSSSKSSNDDENISLTLEAGTYLLGVGAFSGSSDYILDISYVGTSGDAQVELLPVNNKNTFLLLPSGKTQKMPIKAKAHNFAAKTKCLSSYSLDGDAGSDDNVFLKLKPEVFYLSKKNSPQTRQRKSRRIKVIVPGTKSGNVSNWIQENYTETISGEVNIDCDNGASDSFNFEIIPSLESFQTMKQFKYIHKQ